MSLNVLEPTEDSGSDTGWFCRSVCFVKYCSSADICLSHYVRLLLELDSAPQVLLMLKQNILQLIILAAFGRFTAKDIAHRSIL
uniref:Uncharacterized protein n=1 Tax=Syphacia muris TaxID=451379 RepID=A0A0N5AL24_9BILA